MGAPERTRPLHRARATSGNGIDLRRFAPPNGASPALAALRAELGIPEDAPVVGTVGRLVAEKGLRELLEAAEHVRARFPDAGFLAVGPARRAKADAMAAREIDDQLDLHRFPHRHRRPAGIDGRVRPAVLAGGDASSGDRGGRDGPCQDPDRHPRMS